MRFAVLFCLFATSALFGQASAVHLQGMGELEERLDLARKAAGIPALSVAVVEDNKIVWTAGFGHADLAHKKPANAHTVYRVGSVSKLFTDIAVMQLVEEGKLDLDEPVEKYLPTFKPKNQFGKAITLRQLMAHRSGLIRETPVGSYFDPDSPTLEKTVDSLNGLPLVYEPLTKIKYSNAAIAVVGRVVEVVDGRPFPKAVRERVLKKLAMTSSDFEPTDTVKKNLAEALMWTYHGPTFQAPTFELGEGPAGCLYSTANDLALFASALFAEGKGANGVILKPESLAKMFTPQFDKPDAKTGFGLGFVVGELDGQKRLGHGGAIYGFSTELALLPSEKLGVVVISSKDSSNRITTRMADEILRHYLAKKAGKVRPTVAAPKPVTREVARSLAGKYGAENPIELIEQGGNLLLIPAPGGFVVELFAAGEEFVAAGILGNGTRLKCDGKTLVLDGKTFERQPAKDGPPPEPAAHFLGLIGEYGFDHNVMYIFEKEGRLYSLIELFFLYPLTEETKDVFLFPKGSGLYDGEKLIFLRDKTGKATSVEAAQVVFKRRTLDGEDGKTSDQWGRQTGAGTARRPG